MKYLINIYIFFSCTWNVSAQEMMEFDMLTRQFINYLQNHQFNDAEEMLDVELNKLFSFDQIEDLWNRTLLKQGKFVNVEGVVFQDMGGMVVSRAYTRFTDLPLIIQLSFNEDKKISGIELRGVETFYTLPAYANRDLYQEEELFLEVPQGRLPAVFTRPLFVDRFPVVIFIHSSGVHDRDGTVGPNKIFKDLAIGLAVQGIASFRFDKKKAVYPRYFEQIKMNFTVEDEVLEDAASAIQAAVKLNGVNKREVYILGHGLGGMLAPRITVENREVDGVIIMGANSSPLEDILLHRVEYLSSFVRINDNELQSAQSMREQIQQIKGLRVNQPVADSENYLGLPASYWLDLIDYDQVAVAQDMKEPILVVQGGADYQIPADEFELWQTALRNKENASFILYPSLNHVFIEAEGKMVPGEYLMPGHVPEQMIRDIAEWIKHDK